MIEILKEDLIFSRFVNRQMLNNYKSMLNNQYQIIELLENKFKKSWDKILKTNYNTIDK